MLYEIFANIGNTGGGVLCFTKLKMSDYFVKEMALVCVCGGEMASLRRCEREYL